MGFIQSVKRFFTSIGIALGLISDDVDNANFRVVGVIFNPPKGSTVMVGQPIEAIVTYTSDLLDSKSIQLWVQPNDDGVSGSYEPSEFEPTSGRLSRSFSINSVGKLNNICIHVTHRSNVHIHFENREVNYTIVANPEHEKMRGDGQGSQLVEAKILVDGFEIVGSHPRIRVGSEIEVVIHYVNNSKYGIQINAFPEAEQEFNYGYDTTETLLKQKGKITKSIFVDEPVVLDGVIVTVHNGADELLADIWIEKRIEFFE